MKLKATTTALLATFIGVHAERHVVHFNNSCGFGIPTLIQGGLLHPRGLSAPPTGSEFIVKGPLLNAVAYLQTGSCGPKGENCTAVTTTLNNIRSSRTGISLVPPYSFSVASGFGYYGGCDGGADCVNADCPLASRTPNNKSTEVACQSTNVNLAITFCL